MCFSKDVLGIQYTLDYGVRNTGLFLEWVHEREQFKGLRKSHGNQLIHMHTNIFHQNKTVNFCLVALSFQNFLKC